MTEDAAMALKEFVPKLRQKTLLSRSILENSLEYANVVLEIKLKAFRELMNNDSSNERFRSDTIPIIESLQKLIYDLINETKNAILDYELYIDLLQRLASSYDMTLAEQYRTAEDLAKEKIKEFRPIKE